jgi:hemolysin activation/secretion protein
MPIFKSNQERPPFKTRGRRVRMLTRATISFALPAVLALLSCLSAPPVLARAQITLPRPTPKIDPTGRSNEPPMLFEELPQAPPAPGAILPPLTTPEPSESELVPGIRVFVRKIQITGSTVFTSEQFSSLIAPYLDKEVTSEDLEALRVALTRLYVNRGYVNSGAILPDQTVADGVISYQIIAG